MRRALRFEDYAGVVVVFSAGWTLSRGVLKVTDPVLLFACLMGLTCSASMRLIAFRRDGRSGAALAVDPRVTAAFALLGIAPWAALHVAARIGYAGLLTMAPLPQPVRLLGAALVLWGLFRPSLEPGQRVTTSTLTGGLGFCLMCPAPLVAALVLSGIGMGLIVMRAAPSASALAAVKLPVARQKFSAEGTSDREMAALAAAWTPASTWTSGRSVDAGANENAWQLDCSMARDVVGVGQGEGPDATHFLAVEDRYESSVLSVRS